MNLFITSFFLFFISCNRSQVVRKFCIDTISLKIYKCDKFDWKTLKDDIIERVLIPVCKNVHIESNLELKLFIINKLIEFSNQCQNEKQINLIIEIFIKVSFFLFFFCFNLQF